MSIAGIGRERVVLYFTPIYCAIAFCTIFFFNGTGDVGDSIAHYLFARYAPYHPALYFDHWAKPVYVLLASPFAQLGFSGLKIFNALVGLLTMLATFRIAEGLRLKHSCMVLPLMLFSPLYYILTYSGLTEPLFALFVAAGVLMIVNGKPLTAAIIISFLPFVRSEGLIITGVFAGYFAYSRSWRSIPWLLCGSVLYSLAGYFIYRDVLWVFTKIPYATLTSVYGHGGMFHFVEQMMYVTGIPVYLLFGLGLATVLYILFRNGIEPYTHILILGGFSAFFVAHTLFWYLGIFNSMGLKRVLIGVIPLTAIIALYGYNLITENLFKRWKGLSAVVGAVFLLYVIVFPFTANPAAINWNKDMMLSGEQTAAIRVADFIRASGRNKDRPLLYSHHYFSEVFNIDHFDPAKKLSISREHISAMASGDWLIWENLFSERESGLMQAEIERNGQLVKRFVCSGRGSEGSVEYAVYQRK